MLVGRSAIDTPASDTIDDVGGAEHADEAHDLAAARDGDSAAFQRLVQVHAERAWAVCYRITGNTHDAEDALQDALISAWQHLARFRGEARFGTWLYRIAANAALAVIRRRRDVLVGDLPEPPRSHASDHVSRLAEADQIETALRTLPKSFREALILREYGGLTYVEIAEHQHIPVQTVKSRLNRARKAMRTELSQGN